MHIKSFFPIDTKMADWWPFCFQIFNKTLSRAYLLCYLMQDHQTWFGSTSCHGPVSCTITRSLWPSSFTLLGHQRKIFSRAHLSYYLLQDHQTWCGRTSWYGTLSHTITRSLWPTFFLYRTSKENFVQSICFMTFHVGSPNLVW